MDGIAVGEDQKDLMKKRKREEELLKEGRNGRSVLGKGVIIVEIGTYIRQAIILRSTFATLLGNQRIKYT
jgi:hypothetical protein